MPTLTQVLADVLEIRGVLAAAVVSVDGEILAGRAADATLLDRMTDAATGAMAASVALSGLMAKSLAGISTDREEHDSGGAGSPAAAGDGVEAVAAGTGGDVSLAGGKQSLAGSKQSLAGSKQLMVIYEDSGPIVFTPLPGGERVAVVALSSAHDLGRARFQLRGLTHALATAEVPLV